MLRSLSLEEQNDIIRCVEFLLRTSYLDEKDFDTRIGLSKDAVAALLTQWTKGDNSDEKGEIYPLINNVLNELCHGIYVKEGDWEIWFRFSKKDLCVLFDKWQG